MKIKTLEQAKELGLHTYSYSNENWEYEDAEGYWHLFRDNKELLPEIKKKHTLSYSNGDWEYEDTDKYLHLFRDNKELLPEIKKLDTISYANGDWRYKDTKGYWHLIKGDNNENKNNFVIVWSKFIEPTREETQRRGEWKLKVD